MEMRFLIFVCFLMGSLAWSAGLTWKLVDSLPHPQTRFTQGLSMDGNDLLESTGLVGSSRLYRMDRTGKVLDSAVIPAPHFGEGSVRVGDEILVLTWRSGKGLVFDATTLDAKGEFPIPGEGWGLTLADNALWMSNGTASILKLAPDTKAVIGKLDVTFQGKARAEAQ
jgi:glutaminyl-peptide cyclotransferase